MNEQVKQRLVGAVVLVSLAVIFIPMLLDGNDDSSLSRYGGNIPTQPGFDFEPLEIPLEPVPAIPADRPRVIHKAEVPQPQETPPAKQPPPQQRPAPSPAKPEPPAVTTTAKKGDTQPVSWVVQVGSFSSSVNALSLRDKLRKNGFSAFVEKYRDGEKSSYRVRVGPELKRENAEQQLKRLQQKLQLKGIIMGHQ